ncbi:MAG: MFS transporter [Alphaproteobacteria bacterium]
MTIGSSYGQTFFVGLFGGAISDELGLSHAGFGALYSLATLISGVLIFWVGRLVDLVDLRLFAVAVLVGLGLSAALTGLAETTLALTIAFFGLRFFGQGLSSHAAMTGMARYFETGRGKALSLTSLGFPIGNAVWPVMGVAAMAALGWRQAWFLFALTIIVVVVPLCLWFLRGQKARHENWLKVRHEVAVGVAAPLEWSRKQVMRDYRYWVVQALNIAGPFFITGFFFHQVHIAGEKGWTLEEVALAMAVFAAVSFSTNLATGWLVDRLTAARLAWIGAIPLVLGAAMLALVEGTGSLWFYLLPLGVTAGSGVPIYSSLWAELYGTANLGAIKAMNMSLGVGASAASPFLFGYAFDNGWSVPDVAWTAVVWCVVTTLAVLGITRRLQASPQAA